MRRHVDTCTNQGNAACRLLSRAERAWRALTMCAWSSLLSTYSIRIQWPSRTSWDGPIWWLVLIGSIVGTVVPCWRQLVKKRKVVCPEVGEGQPNHSLGTFAEPPHLPEPPQPSSKPHTEPPVDEEARDKVSCKEKRKNWRGNQIEETRRQRGEEKERKTLEKAKMANAQTMNQTPKQRSDPPRKRYGQQASKPSVYSHIHHHHHHHHYHYQEPHYGNGVGWRNTQSRSPGFDAYSSRKIFGLPLASNMDQFAPAPQYHAYRNSPYYGQQQSTGQYYQTQPPVRPNDWPTWMQTPAAAYVPKQASGWYSNEILPPTIQKGGGPPISIGSLQPPKLLKTPEEERLLAALLGSSRDSGASSYPSDAGDALPGDNISSYPVTEASEANVAGEPEVSFETATDRDCRNIDPIDDDLDLLEAGGRKVLRSQTFPMGRESSKSSWFSEYDEEE